MQGTWQKLQQMKFAIILLVLCPENSTIRSILGWYVFSKINHYTEGGEYVYG